MLCQHERHHIKLGLFLVYRSYFTPCEHLISNPRLNEWSNCFINMTGFLFNTFFINNFMTIESTLKYGGGFIYRFCFVIKNIYNIDTCFIGSTISILVLQIPTSLSSFCSARFMIMTGTTWSIETCQIIPSSNYGSWLPLWYLK